ncbi:MAG TPA: hypothetical protein VI461_10590, partial [Chitinophagaceae bacterium]|nr:hypothetical protein [Chitinophagaceae bacterium]
SLVEGLEKIGADFNYNPIRKKNIAENVIVLAGVGRLKEIIELKKKGKIKKLFAGPNICESPNEENGILANKAIDVCIVPSQWVGVSYLEEENDLRGRIEIWHAGVDSNYWQPSAKKKNRDVIIYWKTEEEEFCKAIEDIIRNHNYNPVRVKYGNYSSKEYKEGLDIAVFAVFVSRSESQGIALAEAWSMDVPTYVWDPGELVYKNRKYKNITACPYLTEEAGLKWIELNELKEIVDRTQKGVLSFKPRKYVLRSFSDEQSASDLVNKFQCFPPVK